jgi:hypothetical protein
MPPKRLLRRMLAAGSLNRAEMTVALQEPPNYVSDPVSLKKMLAAMQQHQLVDTDPADRWRIKPELEPLIRQILEPSPLAHQCLALAMELRDWVKGMSGPIDTNDFEARFRARVKEVREKVARDYALTDPALDAIPGADVAVRRIADVLESVAWDLPANPITQ